MNNKQIKFPSDALIEKSTGLRFNVPQLGERVTGFVIRYMGKPYAYVNQCAHVPVEMDWQEGEFFNLTQDFLICATHGAEYAPETGYCVYGPCKGKKLRSIPVTEANDEITIHLESMIS